MAPPLHRILPACLLLLAGSILRAAEVAPAPLPWHESFDGCRDGVVDAVQWLSGVRLSYGGELPGWRREGFHAVHAAERRGTGSAAILLWEDERLTHLAGIAANDAGVGYRLRCDVGPAVYAAPDQATADGDGIVVEVRRGDDTVLAAATILPGPWRGRLRFERHRLAWIGDGTGPVRITLAPLRREGRFAGAIDDLVVERDGDARADDGFTDRVAPLLATRCLACHRGEGADAGLDLSSAAGIAAGGASGPVVDADHPLDGLLWRRVAAGEMPPEDPLSAAETALLRDWIERGAAWSGGSIDPMLASSTRRAGADWWSLQPLVAVTPPVVDDPWPVNDVDRFVLAGLRGAARPGAPPVDRRRRPPPRSGDDPGLRARSVRGGLGPPRRPGPRLRGAR